MTQTREHQTWRAMKARCFDMKCKDFFNYGGRGITVCERWLGEEGFINFFNDMGRRPEGRSIDRYPDNNGNYEPMNCRWATPKQQANNKRNNRVVSFLWR